MNLKTFIALVVPLALLTLVFYSIFRTQNAKPIKQVDTGRTFASNEEVEKTSISDALKKPVMNTTKPTRKNSKIRAAHPIFRIAPVMPNDAGHSGYCNMQFDVTATGRTDNVEALYCTGALFEVPAIASVARWIYEPKTVDGVAVIQKSTTTRVSFNLKDEDGQLLPVPAPVDEDINALLSGEDRAQLKTEHSERIEMLSTIPTSEYCCMRYSVSQIGTVFSADAVSCTDIRQVNEATEFVRYLAYSPASFNNTTISSADYTMLVKFYGVTALQENAPMEVILTIGTQAEKEQVCQFE